LVERGVEQPPEIVVHLSLRHNDIAIRGFVALHIVVFAHVEHRAEYETHGV